MQYPPRAFVEGINVRLKSGGPVMTVHAQVEHLLLCVWMDEIGRVRRQAFAPRELEAAPDAQAAWIHALAQLSKRWRVAATC